MKVPARNLVSEGLCSPNCLLAGYSDPERDCKCRCEGQYHGALADIEIDTTTQGGSWWARCHNGGWSEELLEEHVPVETSTRFGHRLWKASKRAREPYLIVASAGPHRWRLEFDLATTGYSERAIDLRWGTGANGRLLTAFMVELMRHQRATMCSMPPSSHINAIGIKNRHEAMLIAALAGECWAGNSVGVQRALASLRGEPDPYCGDQRAA